MRTLLFTLVLALVSALLRRRLRRRNAKVANGARLVEPGPPAADVLQSHSTRSLAATYARSPMASREILRSAWPDESGFVGEDDSLHAVTQVELGEDARDVALHSRLADVELIRDLHVREAPGEETQDVELAPTQVGCGAGKPHARRWSAAEVLDQAPCDRRCEERLPTHDRPHGGSELLALGVLEQKAARAGFHRAVDVFVEVEGRQHENARTCPSRDKAARSLDAVEFRHADVHEHDVGIE